MEGLNNFSYYPPILYLIIYLKSPRVIIYKEEWPE
jgi:hypothetical protein